MAQSHGNMKRQKTASPSSSGAIKAAMAAMPHANLLPPPDPRIAETARRASLYDEVRELFHDGLMAHEILDQYPDEQEWMPAKMGEWEVVFRREQIQFIEGQDKPAPAFSKPEKIKAANDDYLSLPALEIDKPHLKAVAIKATVWRSDTGEGVEELIWFPRSQIKDGKVSKWIANKKREELEEKHPVKSIDNFPE